MENEKITHDSDCSLAAKGDSAQTVVSLKKCRKCGNIESDHLKVFVECCSNICEHCLENHAACHFCG